MTQDNEQSFETVYLSLFITFAFVLFIFAKLQQNKCQVANITNGTNRGRGIRSKVLRLTHF